MRSFRHQFAHSLNAHGERLHAAAHSHHLWPDVSRAAHMRAWDEAAERADTKWASVLGTEWAQARESLASLLGGVPADGFCLAPNVHELLVRLVSGIENRPIRILSTGSEFHSFTRQVQRWVEAGLAIWEQVPTEPFATLDDRFEEAVQRDGHDLVYASHVFFDSGYRFDEVFRILQRAPARAVVAVDGYHGFMAVPTHLQAVADRVFYLSGGYKYAMSGEGFCFMHAPAGLVERPVDTGWFAAFNDLEAEAAGLVGYAKDGNRFWGATFDPSCIYRFNAVQQMLQDESLDVAALHKRSLDLQDHFLQGLEGAPLGLVSEQLVVQDAQRRGNFLTFRREDATELKARLLNAGLVVDARGDRLRFGFGLYHDIEYIDAVLERVRSA